MTEHVGSELMGEKLGYITYLVHNGKITRKTARCVINHNNEVPPVFMHIIKDLYEKAEYGKLNTICDGITFMEVHNHGAFSFRPQKNYNL